MIRETILRKAYAKISGLTDEDINMAVDSTIHTNEITFRDAIKNMATKADIERVTRVMIMWMVSINFALVGILIAALKLV